MRGVADPTWVLVMAIALGVGLTIYTGIFWLPFGGAANRTLNPRAFWTLIALSLVALALLIAFAIFGSVG
jgi:hypothetical protein